MSDFLVCLNAVAPIFLIMALGYIVRSAGLLSREEVPRLNKLAFRCFMPVMLFYSIYTSDISSAVRPKLILFAAAAVLLVFSVCFAAVLLTEKENARRGVLIQGLYRSNFVIIGIPFAQSLLGADADISPVVVLVSVIVPMFNIIAVVTLELFNGEKPSVGRLLLDILKNPLIIGTAAGIAFLLLGIRLPLGVESAVEQISGIASPLLLFLLGVFFKFDGFRRNIRTLAIVSLGRLVVIPAVVLTAAALIGFRGVELAGLIGIFASATAIASFTMAQQMGGDAELAGDIVVATSALCSFTLFGWSLLFKTLGVL